MLMEHNERLAPEVGQSRDCSRYAAGETSSSVVEAILLFAYLIVWSLVIAAYIAMFVLTGVVTSLLVLACLPFSLGSKAWSKVKPQRSGHGPKAKPIR